VALRGRVLSDAKIQIVLRFSLNDPVVYIVFKPADCSAAGDDLKSFWEDARGDHVEQLCAAETQF
jgi:hypothetical protein